MQETKLPTTLGETIISGDGVTIHGAEAQRFNPEAHFAAPPKPAKIEPQGDVLPMPISLMPSTSFIPKEYQIHKASQRCLSCGTTHEWSRVYAHNNVQSRLGSGKPISNLVPVDHFDYNVPIKVLRAPDKSVPVCHECVGSQDLSHLPRPADTEAYKRIVAAFQNPGNEATPQTAKPKMAVESTKEKAPKAAKTIDSLLDF